MILDALDRAGARGVEFASLRIHCGIGDEALRSALAEMKTEALAADGRRDVWFSAGALREMQAAITARLARLHAEEPLRPFAALNQVSAGAAPTPESRECFRLALDGLRARGEVVAAGERLRLATHQPQWVGRFAAAREKLLAQSRESGLAVPTVAEWAARVGLAEPDCRRALEALAEAGELILLAPGIYVHPETFSRASDRVKEFLAKNGRMNIAQARDLLGASRKYLLPFLKSWTAGASPRGRATSEFPLLELRRERWRRSAHFRRPAGGSAGNCHTHTLLSDGKADAAQTARAYRREGYDFVVLTDHGRAQESLSGLGDKRFLVINGIELHPPAPGRRRDEPITSSASAWSVRRRAGGWRRPRRRRSSAGSSGKAAWRCTRIPTGAGMTSA